MGRREEPGRPLQQAPAQGSGLVRHEAALGRVAVQKVPRPESITLQFIAQKENQADRQQLG